MSNRARGSWKSVLLDYERAGSDDEIVVLLTERQASLLSSLARMLAWGTRYEVAPPDTYALEAEVQERLLGVDICQLVANCISESDAVRGALAEYGIATATPQSTASTGTNLLEGVPCDNDTLYGACEAIVDFANDLCVDFLERVENDTTFVATVARIIDMLPVVGDLPILDDLNDFVNWVTESGITLYESGYTVVLRQTVICNMFCLAQVDCDLTVEDVLAAFAAELSIVVAITEPIELLIRALVQTIADTDFALAFNLLILSVLAAGGRAIGFVGLPSLSSLARTSDPDSDWQVFCDCVVCVDIDLKAADGGFTIDDGDALWTSGAGWGSSASPSPGRVSILKTLPDGLYSSFEIELDTPIAGNWNDVVFDRYDANGNFVNRIQIIESPTATIFTTNVGDNFVSGDQIRIRIQKSQDDEDAYNGHIVRFKYCQ